MKKRCYLVIESQTRRWKDAFAKCQTLKSHMVTISSEEENHFTGQLAKVMLCWVLNEVNNWTYVGASAIVASHPSNSHGTLEENKPQK